MSKLRIGIIGAGFSGLCAAKYAKSYGHSVTVFEQNSEIGGTWIYTDLIDKDEYGLDIHSSMYHDLRYTHIIRVIISILIHYSVDFFLNFIDQNQFA